MGKCVNEHWGHIGHAGHTPKVLLIQLDQSQSSTMHITKKQSNQVVLRPWGHYDNHYIWRLLWLHQLSSHNWVTKKVSLGYAKRVGRGVWTKSRICPSTWRIHTLGPLDDSCIYELASMWLGHGVCNVMKRVEGLVRQGWTTIWGYRWSTLGQDLVSCDKENRIMRLRDKRRVSWNTQGSTWFSRTPCWSLIGEESRSCLGIPRPVGCHA
jgi:hypothetical protein